MNRNDPWLKKKFLKRTNSQGSFLLCFPAGTGKKERAARSRPNIFIIPHTKEQVNIYLQLNSIFVRLHQGNWTFLEMFPSCEKRENVLFFRYRETSFKEILKIDEPFPNIFRLYKNCKRNKMNVPEEFKFCQEKVSSESEEQRGNQWC